MKRFLGAILPLMLASAASAQDVGECDWRASAQALAEPWQENTRTFANGKTRLAVMDVIEPAAGAYYLMVLSPPYDEVGGRQCRIIGMGHGIGFAGIDFNSLDASYDPATGLTFALPVSVYDGANGGFAPKVLGFTLNQATGHIGTGLR